MSPPAEHMTDVSALLASLPLRVALLTDQEGATLLRAGGADAAADLELQRMAATFAQTAEHASKLGMGKSRFATAFYGAPPRPLHVACGAR